jgi:hypothetical protein
VPARLEEALIALPDIGRRHRLHGITCRHSP